MSGAIERVLVALDATAETSAAIDHAVRLAARSKTPLHAVFVEEEDLLSLARLQLARQVVPGTGSAQLSAAEIELHWRAAAARAEAEIRAAAHRRGLEISFEVVRGAVPSALAAASERDFIVAGALARPVAGQFRPQSRWLAAFELAPGPMLLAGAVRPDRRSVVALLPDRGAAASRLLKAAAAVAEPGGGRLTLISPPNLAAAPDFRRWLDEQTDGTDLHLQIKAAPLDAPALPGLLIELGCRLLAIAAAQAERSHLHEMTGGFTCDLLVVR